METVPAQGHNMSGRNSEDNDVHSGFIVLRQPSQFDPRVTHIVHLCAVCGLKFPAVGFIPYNNDVRTICVCLERIKTSWLAWMLSTALTEIWHKMAEVISGCADCDLISIHNAFRTSQARHERPGLL